MAGLIHMVEGNLNSIRGGTMQERESYLPGVPCWLDIMQPDPDAAKEFYGALFGWELENTAPEGAPGPYYVARIRGRAVAAIGGPPRDGVLPMWNPYTAVESADRAAARVRQAGGTVIVEPMDIPGAGRLAVFADTEGAVFSVWEADAFVGAQLVNEPGTWNFSELHTRDAAAAVRFYGSVFDWEVLDFDVGASAFKFFKLSGYGDSLAKSNPEFGERIAADESAAAFADVVAMLVDESSDSAATEPPRWTVTFAVDDADAIAAEAERLGGKVLVRPFNSAPVRMTVLADPQGAVFTASKFQPEEF
jgi:predicted enzyme related to lactoylglutathione lyase